MAYHVVHQCGLSQPHAKKARTFKSVQRRVTPVQGLFQLGLEHHLEKRPQRVFPAATNAVDGETVCACYKWEDARTTPLRFAPIVKGSIPHQGRQGAAQGGVERPLELVGLVIVGHLLAHDLGEGAMEETG